MAPPHAHGRVQRGSGVEGHPSHDRNLEGLVGNEPLNIHQSHDDIQPVLFREGVDACAGGVGSIGTDVLVARGIDTPQEGEVIQNEIVRGTDGVGQVSVQLRGFVAPGSGGGEAIFAGRELRVRGEAEPAHVEIKVVVFFVIGVATVIGEQEAQFVRLGLVRTERPGERGGQEADPLLLSPATAADPAILRYRTRVGVGVGCINHEEHFVQTDCRPKEG
mmetsp:Transcript_14008/g.33969  ORF Transcript_14008/g.33969 Transcript_14008/m.33969 type:complete len:219 (-) Transcript_14008:99-755(-)